MSIWFASNVPDWLAVSLAPRIFEKLLCSPEILLAPLFIEQIFVFIRINSDIGHVDVFFCFFFNWKSLKIC